MAGIKKAHPESQDELEYVGSKIQNHISDLSLPRFRGAGVGTFFRTRDPEGLPRLQRANPSAFLDKLI